MYARQSSNVLSPLYHLTSAVRIFRFLQNAMNHKKEVIPESG